eukprot:scaffold2371_cov265-Chaetoceros_neogracile.AAC.4
MDVDLSYTESKTTTHNAIENSATFTTVCNHAFHMHCLLQWEDAPCCPEDYWLYKELVEWRADAAKKIGIMPSFLCPLDLFVMVAYKRPGSLLYHYR